MHGNIVLGLKPNALLEFFLHVAKSSVQPLLFLLYCLHMSLDTTNFLLIYKPWSLSYYNQFFCLAYRMESQCNCVHRKATDCFS